jgi:undecaprenyl-phosphate galactose phosphotransferase/putative colanic acid biosynthesis UDP-glucose lipid carrier transferase
VASLERNYASEAQAAHHRSWIGPKRTFDIAVRGAGAARAASLLLLMALAIKLDSRGPLLFRQRRYGRDMRSFTVLKFRTMHDGATAESIAATSPASPPAKRTRRRASRSSWTTRA